MSDILYERPLGAGPVVRVRRTSVDGIAPVRAVIEVDRRGTELRDGQRPGHPPWLLDAEGPSDADVLATLLPYAADDSELAKLMRDHGLR
jgi:hypothetical protein